MDGMDPTTLEEFVEVLDEITTDVSTTMRTLTERITQLEWGGQDATAARLRWNTSVVSLGISATTELGIAAENGRAHALEQRRVSQS